mgnify:CR=1 FL=1
MNTIENKYMDTTLLSKYILISRSKIYKMVSNDRIPYHKIDNRTIFDKDEIDRWIKNNGLCDTDLPQLP